MYFIGNNSYGTDYISIKELYEDVKNENSDLSEFLDIAKEYLKDLGIKIKKEIFKDPNQLSLFDQLEQDKKLWEEIKDKWIESGRTEADFNSMNNEEREHTIKNCL